MNANYVLNTILLSNEEDKERIKVRVINRKPSIGISYPNLKLISKQIIASNSIEFLETNNYSVYELEILQTYVIGQIKDKQLGLKYFDEFTPYAKEWSVVDSLCQKFVLAKKYQKEVFELLIQYSLIDDEYMQRIVAVTLLSHYINDEYIDQSIDLINQLNHPGYYCKMAKAWALATMMIKYPDKIIDYLNQHRLDVWTHNKTIQKAIESFRITKELKAEIIHLKR